MWGKFVYREIVRRSGSSSSIRSRTRTAASRAIRWRRLAAGDAVDLHVRGSAGGKTKFTVRWSPHNATDEERKTFDAGHDSMTQGWGGTLEQLGAYLAKAK